MPNPIKAIPSTGSINIRWRSNGEKNLINGGTAYLFVSQEDVRTDAIVVENNGEYIASGWVSNIMETGDDGEIESYHIMEGKEAEVANLLSQYQQGSEKARNILDETKNFGMGSIFITELFITLCCGLLVFGIFTLDFFKTHSAFFFTLVVGIALVPTIFTSFKRKKVLQAERKKRFLKIIDELLLCRIYMIANDKCHKSSAFEL